MAWSQLPCGFTLVRKALMPTIRKLIKMEVPHNTTNFLLTTVIGALGAGGIGLVLVETMCTQRDWENVLYIIMATSTIVILIDSLSSRLSRKLIQG